MRSWGVGRLLVTRNDRFPARWELGNTAVSGTSPGLWLLRRLASHRLVLLREGSHYVGGL